MNLEGGLLRGSIWRSEKLPKFRGYSSATSHSINAIRTIALLHLGKFFEYANEIFSSLDRTFHVHTK